MQRGSCWNFPLFSVSAPWVVSGWLMVNLATAVRLTCPLIMTLPARCVLLGMGLCASWLAACANLAPTPTALPTALPLTPTATLEPTATPLAITGKNLPQLGQRARLGRGTVQVVAWAPSGEQVAIGSATGLDLYDTTTWVESAALELNRAVYAAAYAPTRPQVAFTSDDLLVRVVELKTGKVGQTLAGHTAPPRWVAYTEAGDTLVSGSFQEVILWNPAGHPTLSMTVPGGIVALALSPDGKWVALSKLNGTIEIWSAALGALARTYNALSTPVQQLTYAPAGKYLAAGNADGVVWVWDTQASPTAAPVLTFTHHTGPITALAFNADGTQLAAGSEVGLDGVQVWQLPTGLALPPWLGHPDGVRSLQFAPSAALPANQLLSAGSEGNVLVWAGVNREPQISLSGYTPSAGALALDAAGRVGVSSSGRDIRLWAPETLQALGIFRGHLAAVTALALSPDGQTLASSGQDATLRLWDVALGQQRVAQVNQPQLIQALAFHPNGQRLVSGDAAGNLQWWAADTLQAQETLTPYQSPIVGLTFNEAGTLLASVTTRGRDPVRLWDTNTNTMVLEVAGQDCVALSPDGRWLATGDPASLSNVIMWNATSGKRLFDLDDHTADVTALAFSPDNTLLISAGRDNRLLVWEVRTGKLLRDLLGHSNWVTAALFSPNGRLLFSSSADGTVRLWGLPTR